jgi:hypothetical protein
MNMLKPYMIYSRTAGPQEGAALVFAHTAREARKIGWNGIGSDLTGGEFTDLAAGLIHDGNYLFADANPDKLAKDESHVIDSPRGCDQCEMWGQSAIGEDGLCEGCRENREPG